MEAGKQKFASFGMNTPEFSFMGRKLWARVVSVYDGDTMTLVFPVSDCMYKFNARMFGIDTCEMKSKEAANKDLALKARNRVIELVTKKPFALQVNAGRKEILRYLEEDVYLVWIECLEFDKYGRVLVKVFPDSNLGPDARTFSDVLIEEKLAYPYFGDTKLSEGGQTMTLLS